VFGQGAIQRDERIVMGELIKEVLNEVRPLAQARNITISTSGLESDLPAVYGSHAWLSKALSEYLEHSIRSAQDDGLIEFSIVALGTRLLLRARNQGLFVSNHERRSAFVPFGVGDGIDQVPARQGIGLALSQRIIAAVCASKMISMPLTSSWRFRLAHPLRKTRNFRSSRPSAMPRTWPSSWHAARPRRHSLQARHLQV